MYANYRYDNLSEAKGMDINMNMNSQNGTENKETHTTVEPFNDVTEHYQMIIGMPNKREHMYTFPKWLRIFYYSVITVVTVGVLAMLGIKIYEWVK